MGAFSCYFLLHFPVQPFQNLFQLILEATPSDLFATLNYANLGHDDKLCRFMKASLKGYIEALRP